MMGKGGFHALDNTLATTFFLQLFYPVELHTRFHLQKDAAEGKKKKILKNHKLSKPQ